MSSKRYLALVFRVAHEQWEKSDKPDQAYWFHHYLIQSEENYVQVVNRCLEVLHQEEGDLWMYLHDFDLICMRIVMALGHWD
jgi:hypothetical protein